MEPASVHRGVLLRWFEELCRLNYKRLAEVTNKGHLALAANEIPPQGGVYAFWWTGSLDKFRSTECNRIIHLPGPGGSLVPIEVDDDWLGLKAGLPIPLYIGKTAAGLRKRVGLHLMLKTDRLMQPAKGSRKIPAPTTSCQLRAGVERFFPNSEDSRELVLHNVGLSYVVLPGPDHAVNRFYLEDLAIGMMQPPLNIDVER